MASPKLLQDIRILCTNLSSKERQYIQNLAQQQAAVVLTSAAFHDPPHVLITRRVGSAKYVAVLKRNPATPVVTPEWLTQSVGAGQRLAYDAFRVLAFSGLLVCFSGLTIAEKNALAKQVQQLGGSHSPSLHAECTHLITSSTDSDKYRFALTNGITCVTERWLTDSAAAGWCQDERGYEVAPGTQKVQQREASVQIADDMATGPHSTSAVDVSICDTWRQPDVSQQRSADAGGQRGSSRLAHDGLAASASADVGAGAAAASARVPIWNDLDCDDDAPLFLDACYIWVVGCSGTESFDAMKLCRQGGAKRFVDPPPGMVTHIVVGSQIGPVEADCVLRYSSDHKQALLVGLEWLRRSCSRRQLLPADERFAVSAAMLADAAQRQPSAATGTANGNGAAGALERGGSMGAALAARAKAAAAQAAPALVRQPSGVGAGFFEDCYFTLAAVRGTPEEAAAERIIRTYGGRTFNASLPTRVACRQARAFAICPPALPPTAAAAVRAANPDFGAVLEGGRLTLYWLECCVQAGAVLPAQRGSPCYAPLPYSLPLPGMESVSVTISGYEPTVRAAIQRTVEIVGGRVSVEYMSARDTHLIVASARGEKYRHAARFNVVPVTADWLVDSVTQGRLQPEQNYRPRLPPGGAPLLPADAGTVRAGSVSAPSQIGATQLPGAATFSSLFQAAMAGDGAGSSAAAVRAAPAPAGGPPKESSLRERVKRLTAATATQGQQAAPDENAARVRQAAPPVQPRPLKRAPQPPPAAVAQPPQPAAPAVPLDLESLLGGDGLAGAAAGGAAAAAVASILHAAPRSQPPAAATEPTDNAFTPAAGGVGAGDREAAAAGGASGGGNASGRGKKSGTRSGCRQRSPAVGSGEDELASALDDVSSMLDKMRARQAAPGGVGSQLDMPPPPPRPTAAGAAGAEASGRRSRGSKRSSDADGSRPSVRRSTRHKAGWEDSQTPLEMSQQVGYAAPAVGCAGGPEVGAAADAAKQRLRAVTRQRSGAEVAKNGLDSLHL